MPLGEIEDDKIKGRINKMNEIAKLLTSAIDWFFKILGLMLLIPILLVIAVPIIVVLSIVSLIGSIKEKKRLKKLIESNNGKLYFIYADYNNYDFSNYFKDNFKHINCIKVESKWYTNDLIGYLTKDCVSESFPRLVRIEGDSLVSKVHYRSFKSLYKKKNDIESFFSLLEKSIKNLENGTSITRSNQ